MSIKGIGKLNEQIAKLSKQLEELQDFCTREAEITTELNFNPNDPDSVKNAIHTFEKKFDERVLKYRDNPMIVKIAKELKMKYVNYIKSKSN